MSRKRRVKNRRPSPSMPPVAPNQAPAPAFTFVITGSSVAFTNTSEDPDGTISSYAWTFGDGGTATFASPTHVYAAPGTYNVQLTVTDNGGMARSLTRTVTITSGDASIANLQDDFNDNSRNAALWQATSDPAVAVQETNGRVECTVGAGGAHSGGYLTASQYNLIGASVKIELAQAATAGQVINYFELLLDANNVLGFEVEQTAIRAVRKTAGTATTLATAVYSAVNHRWMRFSEAAGTVTWATSPDGTTWTTLATNAPGWALTSLRLQFGVRTL